MLGLKQFIELNEEVTEQAEQDCLEPREAICNGDETIKYCPKLGNFIPKGFELVQSYFVDNSGFGSDSEPALTFEQFLKKVKKGRFYAIGEEGQLQLYINEYKKTK